MISKPMDWISNGGKDCYIGGIYRYDLTELIFVHKSGLSNHKITDQKPKKIKMQSIELVVNKQLQNYINDHLSPLEDLKEINVLDLATKYIDIKFYIPMYVDWRGRIYTSTSLLTSQFFK